MGKVYKRFFTMLFFLALGFLGCYHLMAKTIEENKLSSIRTVCNLLKHDKTITAHKDCKTARGNSAR